MSHYGMICDRITLLIYNKLFVCILHYMINFLRTGTMVSAMLFSVHITRIWALYFAFELESKHFHLLSDFSLLSLTFLIYEMEHYPPYNIIRIKWE